MGFEYVIIFSVWIAEVAWIVCCALMYFAYKNSRSAAALIIGGMIGFAPAFFSKNQTANLSVTLILLFVPLIVFLLDLHFFKRIVWFFASLVSLFFALNSPIVLGSVDQPAFTKLLAVLFLLSTPLFCAFAAKSAVNLIHRRCLTAGD